jgi:hypothetical protein
MVKLKFIFQFIIYLLLSSRILSQDVKGITFCVDSIIYNLQKKEKIGEVVLSKEINLKGYSQMFKHNINFLEWLDKIEKDSLKIYELQNNEIKYYFFSSKAKFATGLAINFTFWFVLVSNDNFNLEFISLSRDNRLIFFDKKTLRVKFFLLNYGDSFFWKRDWDNIHFKVELHKINKKSTDIIYNFETSCFKY